MTGKAYVWTMIIIIAAVGVEIYRVSHTPEVIAKRCATYDLDRIFDDCVKDKSCAIQHGRHSEWYEYVGYRTNTYDCPKGNE